MIYDLAPSTISGFLYIQRVTWEIYFELVNYLEESNSVNNAYINFRQYLALLECYFSVKKFIKIFLCVLLQVLSDFAILLKITSPELSLNTDPSLYAYFIS